MVTVARELSIEYGGLTVGASTNYHIDGPITVTVRHDSGSVTFSAICQADTEAGFASACQSFESSFSARRSTLIVKFGSNTFISWKHSDNTGFNSEATVTKAGDVNVDSGRARRYNVTVTVVRPASDDSGLREMQATILYKPSRLVVATFVGQCTALGGSSASAQYAAAVPGICTGILGGIGGTFELTGENTSRDRTDKILTFTREYTELNVNQSVSLLDDTAFVKHAVICERVSFNPGDSIRGTRRLEQLVVSFEAAVDKTVSTDLPSLYESKVKPYLKAVMLAEFEPVAFALLNETHNFNEQENMISARLTYLGLTKESKEQVVESTEFTEYDEEGGTVFTQPWSGGIYDAYLDQGHAQRLMTKSVSKMRLGPHEVHPGLTGGPQFLKGSTNWVLIRRHARAQRTYIGDPDEPLEATVTLVVETYRYVVTPGSGGGGGGTVPAYPAPEYPDDDNGQPAPQPPAQVATGPSDAVAPGINREAVRPGPEIPIFRPRLP